MPPLNVGVTQLFQSTLSMRRATLCDVGLWERDDISIHALHEESDRKRGERLLRILHFNPRSP